MAPSELHSAFNPPEYTVRRSLRHFGIHDSIFHAISADSVILACLSTVLIIPMPGCGTKLSDTNPPRVWKEHRVFVPSCPTRLVKFRLVSCVCDRLDFAVTIHCCSLSNYSLRNARLWLLRRRSETVFNYSTRCLREADFTPPVFIERQYINRFPES